MNDPELVDEARRWLRFATEDLDVAKRLLAQRMVHLLVTPVL